MTPKLRYRKISVRIWSDSKFRELSTTAKLVWFFILTNPNMGGIGAMRATIPGMAAEMGIPDKAFKDAFREVLDQGLVQLDDKASLLVVPNFLKHNTPESPNVVKGWMSKIDELPECNLLTLYFQQVKGFMEGLGEAFTEGLLKGFGEALPEGSRKGIPNQEQEHLPLHLQEPLQKTPLPPKGEMATQFEIFWNAYPKRKAIADAKKAWFKLNPDSELQGQILKAVQDQCKTEEWKKEGGKYIPYPASWLNGARWKDQGVQLEIMKAVEPVPLNRYTRFAEGRAERIRANDWSLDPELNPGEKMYQDYKAQGLCE